MKIGELAARTGVAPRLIRYYEQQDLLTADRQPNGYRDYGEAHVERVERVAGLVQAGIPTRLVKVLMDAEEACAREEPTCPAEVAALLAAELDGLEKRIACLSRSRDTIHRFLDQTRAQVAPAPAPASA
ncbi:MerR family transcriptional regulator [Pimelobacter simplex]|uniref:MerR-family transcriptional regulator n=1 Tax=Nocardioides simplex TaxID=2045 RepID=A0A0A1DK14_NOCSI|nr:MerR family transcriptional regulator [Pimelobacter simplex]AIY17679.1 MerR-family transcriptional regulator [Pimelobacter simplex]MCG8150119.1 MerR family transcriptional regulator [Pimelobacter simplex]GEB13671.1 MerR family transcriptional regulator [Pimelobacter simplex]SFM70205.1 DNA-binding transcriptional regulator, MerR family [Pimelobacter simplex]